jgi:hypothetical protein
VLVNVKVAARDRDVVVDFALDVDQDTIGRVHALEDARDEFLLCPGSGRSSGYK